MWLRLNVTVTTVAAAADAAAPPTSSGTPCEAASPLRLQRVSERRQRPPRLRYSQRRRKKGLKRFFAQQPRRYSAPRATTQRRRICASRCCCHMASTWDKRLLVPIQDAVASARVERRYAAIESSPEERSASGSLRACLSERSEFAGPPLARVPEGWHEVPDDFGSVAAPNPCARDAPKIFSTRNTT
jgi:hypothetical protein